MKTYASMSEASSLLLDDDGNLKSLNKFTEDIKKLNDTYNDNYLRAERNFASRSAQSAAKWQKYEEGKDRYDLKYMTMLDDRVRPEHQELEGITLPVDDPFWNEYMPPNGYNCRCVTVQVRKGEYPVSDSTDAIAKGDQATTQIGKDGSNKAAIFRFNPGKEMKVMPPEHPYTSGNCGQLSAVWHTLSVMQKIQLSGQADKCRAKKVVEEMEKSNARKEKDREIAKWAKINIPVTTSPETQLNFFTGKVQVTRRYLKEFSSHFTEPKLKEMAKDIHKIVREAEFIESKPLSKNSPNYQKKLDRGVTGYSYYRFKWGKQNWRLNAEIINDDYEKPYSANLLKKKSKK